MKKREIEKQLKNDISVSSRSDFSKILEKCNTSDNGYAVKERSLVTVGGEKTKRSNIKPMLFVCILLAFLLIGATMLIMMTHFDNTPKYGGYFVIDINPSIKISYDKDGNVTEVTALNEDADVLLVGTSFTGKSTDEVITLLFEKCVQLGYLSSDRDNNAIMASATLDNGERDDDMTKKVKDCFSKEFSDKKIRGVVITGVQSPELDAEAQKHGIDSQKYGLILEYLELGGELDDSEYSNISISELYKKISDKEKELKQEHIESKRLECDNAESKIFDTIRKKVNELRIAINTLSEGNNNDVPSGHPPADKPNGPKGGAPMPRNINDSYDDIILSLDKYLSELDSKPCELAVGELLQIFNDIKSRHLGEDIDDLIDEISSELQTLVELFSEKSKELSSLNASIEGKNSARLDAFKDKPRGEHENVADWQREKENEIASSWYEYKKQWNDERKNDLKK